jgi:hypothetical protein
VTDPQKEFNEYMSQTYRQDMPRWAMPYNSQCNVALDPERLQQWVDGQRALSQQEMNVLYANALRRLQNAFAQHQWAEDAWRADDEAFMSGSQWDLSAPALWQQTLKSIQRRFDRCCHGR